MCIRMIRTQKLNKKSNPLLGAVVGATGTNAISDGIAAALDPTMQGMTYGIVLGCISVMFLIPIIEKLRSRSDETG